MLPPTTDGEESRRVNRLRRLLWLQWVEFNASILDIDLRRATWEQLDPAGRPRFCDWRPFEGASDGERAFTRGNHRSRRADIVTVVESISGLSGSKDVFDHILWDLLVSPPDCLASSTLAHFRVLRNDNLCTRFKLPWRPGRGNKFLIHRRRIEGMLRDAQAHRCQHLSAGTHMLDCMALLATARCLSAQLGKPSFATTFDRWTEQVKIAIFGADWWRVDSLELLIEVFDDVCAGVNNQRVRSDAQTDQMPLLLWLRHLACHDELISGQHGRRRLRDIEADRTFGHVAVLANCF